jgi:hypothetical protein
MSDGAYGLVRWEARSHAQIYHEVHVPTTGSAPHALATTVPWWKEIAADLHEIRSRYESLVKRLMNNNAGTGAEAAGGSARLVLRGLTDAHELTCTAGAQRTKLNNLNVHLRQEMPEPMVPTEVMSGFIDQGRTWLVPPDFDREDSERHNAGERARDLMRDYERAIASPALTEDVGPQPVGHTTANVVDKHLDSPTVPLSTARAHTSPVATGVDHPPGTAVGWGPQVGANHPAPDWDALPPEFGPQGHALPADAEEQQTGAMGSAPPPPRDNDYSAPHAHRGDDNPFASDGKAFPPVIGA